MNLSVCTITFRHQLISIAEIAKWSEGEMFIDFQTKGPYSLWWHEHRIIENSNTTSLMEDRVLYRVPLGLLGRDAHLYIFIL